MTKTPRKRISIIAAEFNQDIMNGMISAAKQEIKDIGARLVRVVRVPGCYEVPLSAELELEKEGIDALVVLGYIERGETLHGQVMGQVVHQALVQLQLGFRKRIGLGIIGPGATVEQAQARKEGYARAAVRAAFISDSR